MNARIQSVGNQLAANFTRRIIFRDNVLREEGAIKSLPDELIIKIFFENERNIPSLMTTSRRFMRLGMERSAIVQYAHQIWPGLLPTFSQATKTLPAKEDIKKTIYDTLSRELQILEISEPDAGLTTDLRSFRKVNRLIDAASFCLFSHFVIEDRSLARQVHTSFKTPVQIFALEKEYRERFKHLDYSSVKEINAYPAMTIGLTRLPEEIGKFENLESLICNCNHLFFLPKSIINLQKLNFLNLSANEFASFPEVICNLHSLETLNVRYNKNITEIPETIGNLKNLKILVLSNDTIGFLPSSMKKLHNLQKFISQQFSPSRRTAIENQRRIITQLAELLPNCEIEDQ